MTKQYLLTDDEGADGVLRAPKVRFSWFASRACAALEHPCRPALNSSFGLRTSSFVILIPSRCTGDGSDVFRRVVPAVDMLAGAKVAWPGYKPLITRSPCTGCTHHGPTGCRASWQKGFLPQAKSAAERCQSMIMQYPELVGFKKCTLSLTDTFSANICLALPIECEGSYHSRWQDL
jgi:hypothetical protein